MTAPAVALAWCSCIKRNTPSCICKLAYSKEKSQGVLFHPAWPAIWCLMLWVSSHFSYEICAPRSTIKRLIMCPIMKVTPTWFALILQYFDSDRHTLLHLHRPECREQGRVIDYTIPYGIVHSILHSTGSLVLPNSRKETTLKYVSQLLCLQQLLYITIP